MSFPLKLMPNRLPSLKHLHGYKWFSSAIDADIALTLARIVDKDGNSGKGSRGLSLFLLKIRNGDGQLNGIQMIRLKNKLGTKQLPTAELLLDGTVAHCLGAPGRGVANISNMLNITRIHNAVASVSGMRSTVESEFFSEKWRRFRYSQFLRACGS
ncbi:unnamed protein product [Cylicostephanus goldi]|uniref:Uncharacterized protein n=1 Tax=Cylicostephanus goldi TaxID=71465 RepID=A0A3P7N769_CYLGO|nr:unnamed protein product [Cylicostephanus goldi]